MPGRETMSEDMWCAKNDIVIATTAITPFELNSGPILLHHRMRQVGLYHVPKQVIVVQMLSLWNLVRGLLCDHMQCKRV